MTTGRLPFERDPESRLAELMDSSEFDTGWAGKEDWGVWIDDRSHHPHGCQCTGCAGSVESEEGEETPGAELVAAHLNAGGTNGNPPVTTSNGGTLGELADYLTTGFWSDFGTVSRKYNLSDTGPNAKSGVLEYNISGFTDRLGASDTNGLSEPRRELVREAFKVFEEVLGIRFEETTSENAEFLFTDNETGAFAYSVGSSLGLSASQINIAASWSGSTSTYDDYTLQTIFHEIGHALGLGHQGDYNGSGGFSDAVFANDSWQASMMSYLSQNENPNIPASREFLQTPMAVDWLALDRIYGGDSFGGQTYGVQNAFEGNTVYGFNTNISASVSDIWANFSSYGQRTASTIVDGGGIDTLDVSGWGNNSRIDLSVASANDIEASISSIGGRFGNLTIAAGTVIENATGGAGSETFFGNGADNVFRGNGGNDTFNTSRGSDTYYGGSGSDTVRYYEAFADFTFDVSGSFLSVTNAAFAGIDMIQNTVEFLAFDDVTLGFADVVAGLEASAGAASVTGVTDNAGSITGSIADGGATDDASPRIAGTLDSALAADQSVGVYRDGGYIGEATVTGTSWSYTDQGLGDGSYTYTARVLDPDGDGALSDGYGITVDRTAPAVTVAPVATGDGSPALSGTVDDPGASVTVSVDGQSYGAAVSGTNWSIAAGTIAALAPGTYDVIATATDAVGNSASDTTTGELAISAAAPLPVSAALELGNVSVSQSNSLQWHRVDFSIEIPDAVVVMGPLSMNGGQATVARVRDVSDTGFEFQLDEWDYLDGAHAREDVSWMAVSEGTNEFGGMTVSAGVASARNQTLETVDMGNAFGSDAPMVMAQVASFNGGSAVTTRIRNVDEDSFEFRMQEQQGADGKHGREDVHWIAVETGDGAYFDTAVTGSTYTHVDKAVTFDAVDVDTGVFLAAMQTTNGFDTAALRYSGFDGDSALVRVQEEQSADSEIAHGGESVGFLTAEEGVWTV